MKKLIGALLFFLWSCPALANVPCTIPFNLQNGQPADATQVMANYNAIVACLANAAAAGNNSDITQLSGLAVPLQPAFGGTQTFVGTVDSTGSSNAYVVATTTPPWTALTRGYSVVFTPNFSNTGPATLQVGGSAATPILRRTVLGKLPLVGGEIALGEVTVVNYDGTAFQLITDMQLPIGTVLETVAPTADAGFVLMQGQCIASTGVFSALYIRIGSPPTGVPPCAAGEWALPDGRGRVVAMADSGGSNRITVAGGNFNGSLLFQAGGQQNTTLLQSDLPNVPLNVPSGQFGHKHGDGFFRSLQTGSGIGPFDYKFTTNPGGLGTASTTDTETYTTTPPAAGFLTTSINGGTTQTTFTNLPPIIILNRQIKY